MKKAIQDFLRKLLPKGRLMQGAFALSGVTLLAQAASALLSPVYARLYSPSDYGVVGVYGSFLTIFLTIGALCYEQGILIGRDDDEAKDIVFIASVVIIGASLLSVVLLSFGLLQIGGAEQSLIGPYLWFLPIGILLGGTYKVIQQWAMRQKAIKVIAESSAYQNAGAHVVMMGMGVLSPSPMGLILGGIVSVSAGIRTVAVRTLALQGFRERTRWKSYSRIWSTVKRYRRLPLIQAPSTLLNSLGLFLPAILMVSYYGTECGGWLNMAQRFMGLPMALIGGSISQIFFSEAADIARNNPSALKPFFDRVVLKALKITIVIVLAGWTSPLTFPLVFGEKWREAGMFAAWISLYCSAGLMVSPVSSIPTLVGKLHGQLWLDGLRALLIVLAFYVPHILGKSAETAVISYSLVIMVMYLAYYLLYRHQVSEVSSTGRTQWQ
jgi:O-antigen/teichoic acid export membrane protein